MSNHSDLQNPTVWFRYIKRLKKVNNQGIHEAQCIYSISSFGMLSMLLTLGTVKRKKGKTIRYHANRRDKYSKFYLLKILVVWEMRTHTQRESRTPTEFGNWSL